jgi:hypothetical protein
MARALLMFRLPGFEFGPASTGSRFKTVLVMGFACGVAAGLVHARMIGLL